MTAGAGRPDSLEARIGDLQVRVQAAEAETDRVAEAARTARLGADHARRHLALLAAAGDVLAPPLEDHEPAFAALADVFVPDLADWCAVDLDDGGSLRRLAWRREGWDDEESVESLLVRHPGWRVPVRRAMDERIVALTFDVVAAQGPGSGDDDHLTVARGLGLESYVIVPIVVEGHAMGAISCATAPPRRGFRPSDAAAVAQVAVRAAATAERVLLHRQLARAERMEAVGRLAGGVAHDFNNLLTVILGYSDILRRTLPEDDPNRTAVDAIRLAGERAANLSAQLLAMAKARVASREVVDLNALVAATMALVVGLLPPGVQVETELDPAAGAVLADPGQLEQMVLNLALNARDAMPTDGRLVITTAPAGDAVVITFADTGAGMDPQVAEHCFEPFFTTKPKGEGVGLGLATVYAVATQAGGSVSVASRRGEGAVFTIRLPTWNGGEPPPLPGPSQGAGAQGSKR